MKVYGRTWSRPAPLTRLIHLERARDGDRSYVPLAGGKRWAIILIRERRP